jgi:hypothetical protein
VPCIADLRRSAAKLRDANGVLEVSIGNDGVPKVTLHVQGSVVKPEILAVVARGGMALDETATRSGDPQNVTEIVLRPYHRKVQMGDTDL